MAGSTLSFFTRLFSSKKKKILEKRREKESIGIGNIDTKKKPSKVIGKTSLKTDKNDSFSSSEDSLYHNRSEYVSRESEAIKDTDIYNTIYIQDEEKGDIQRGYEDESGNTISTKRRVNDSRDRLENSDKLYEDQSIDQEKLDIDHDRDDEESGKDDSLEYDSMVLLSKLEQLMIRLSDNNVQKSIPLVIEALVEMTNYVVEFAEQLPIVEQKKITLEALLNRDEQSYKILGLNYINSDRLVIEVSTVTECSNSKEIFIDLSNDLLRVINVYLSASVKAFKSSRISEQWKMLYTGFFVNLTKSVRSSQANQKN